MSRTNFIAPNLAALVLTFVVSHPAAAQSEQVQLPAAKGTPAIQNAFALQGPISHGDLLDLGEDDHLQYALLAGRAGGQILSGGTNSGDALALQGSTANDGNILLNALGGNVGIGTGAPAFLLDVNGAANIAGNLTVGGTLSVPGNFNFSGDLTVDGTVFTHFVTANSPLQLQTDGITRIYIDDNLNNGRVGIGNPPPVPPQFPLDVNGSIHTNDDVFADGSLSVGNASPFWAIEVIKPQAVARLITTAAVNGSVVELRKFNAGGTYLGAVNFNDPGNTTPGQLGYLVNNAMTFRTGGVEHMRLDGTGNLGLGTTSPASRLHVVGDAEIDGAAHTTGDLAVDGKVLTHFVNGNSPLELQTDGVTRIYIDDNGNNGHVGVGNAPPVPPAFPLDVNGDIHTNAQLRSSIPDGTAPMVVASMTRVDNLNVDKLDGISEEEFALLAGRPGGQVLHGGDAAGDDLVLDSTSDPMKGFVILNPTPVGPGTGSVGIGTMNPTEALEVIGCIKADCLKITAPNFVGVSPLGMVRAGTSIDVLAQVDGTAKVRASAVGTHSTMIPVNLHTSLFGTQQKLANVQVYYKLTSPNSFIAVTRARIMGANGTFTNLAVNATQQKSTAWTSYFVTPATPVDITGPLYLNFELNYTGTNTAHDIQIGQITLTTVE